MRQGLFHVVRYESHDVILLFHVEKHKFHVVDFVRQHFLCIFATRCQEQRNTVPETLQHGASQIPAHDISHKGA